jgi:hypothetical protein
VLGQYVETQLTCCSDAMDEAEPNVYDYLEHGLVIPFVDLGPPLLESAMMWNFRSNRLLK